MIENSLIKQLKQRLNGELPGESSHIRFLPQERRRVLRYDNNILPKASSILILLFRTSSDNFFSTLLIKRTPDNSVHSGQISFPGGKADEGDLSPIHTALREAQEETGITPEHIEVLGLLSPLYVSPSNFEISPVVGYIDQSFDPKPNPAEVEYIIELPLKNIEQHFKTIDLEVRDYVLKQVPCFNFNGQIIWGATAMILQELLDLLKDIRNSEF